MENRKIVFIFLLSFLFLFLFGYVAPQVKEKDLPPKYQDWLKLVNYHITPKEKEVFLKLTTDRDRDIFIELFWKMRDPTPGTPENEFKEELIKRFEYVNKYFSRATTREGWQTDMGKIYMILGPPASIETFEGAIGIVPCQAWSYYGDQKKGLPPQFVLVFFKKGGVGEFKLYDPVSDGPYELLENKREFSPDDYEGLYERIANLAPTLADSSISIIPGEYSLLGYTPSPRNTIILQNILESGRKEINPTYATHFLDFKGLVSTEYMTNYVDSESEVEIIPDPVTGLIFVHFIIAPKSVSVDYYEPKNQYYCSFRLDVSLRQKDKVIFQYNRDWPVYFPEEAVDRIKANGLAFEDCFPAAEGRYQLVVLLQNSVGKEFCLLEKELEVKPLPEQPAIYGPYLGYRIEQFEENNYLPFKLGTSKLVLDPKQTFSKSDRLNLMFTLVNLNQELHSSGLVRVMIRGLGQNNTGQKIQDIKLNQKIFSRQLSYEQIISLEGLSPDYYEVILSLIDGRGQVLDEKKGNFIITPQEIIGHPISKARALPLSRQYVFLYVLGSQYDKLNDDRKAAMFYQLAFSSNAEFREGVLDYSRFLLKVKQFDRLLEVVEKLKEEEKSQFEYHLLRGQAFMGKEDFKRAIEELQAANSIYNSDLTLLNSLGMCYYRLGEKPKAVAAFRASLKLNPDQPEIQKLLKELAEEK
jgi:GWxTD domain-containing protein